MSGVAATIRGICRLCFGDSPDIIDDIGAVAQSVEHLHGMQGVARSIRVSSTFAQVIDTIGFTLGGFVAGEGSFIVTRKLPAFADGSRRLRFVFSLTMAERDRQIVEALRLFLGRGSIRSIPKRAQAWLPGVCLTIGSLTGHHNATIPFADRYLLASEKRNQYQIWKSAMEAYELEHPSMEKDHRPAVFLDAQSQRAVEDFAAVTTIRRLAIDVSRGCLDRWVHVC